jgi:DNA-binding FadR family transcriptional regulator
MNAEANRTDTYRKLAEAVCAGDAAGAGKAAQDVLERANSTMIAAFERREKRR